MIEVNNLTTNKVDETYLKGLAKKVLEEENKKTEISIVLVGQGRIRELNKKYRKKNKVTDVLSFQYDNHKTGEIVVCLREVKKNAKKFNSTYKKELSRILIHGILHVLGYDHEKSEKAAEKMEEKQNYYLKNA